MTIDDKIRDEKLQYDINRKASKISALSSGRVDKYSPFGKVFVKQIKNLKIKKKNKWKHLSSKESSSLNLVVKKNLQHFRCKKKFLKNLLMKEQMKYKI